MYFEFKSYGGSVTKLWSCFSKNIPLPSDFHSFENLQNFRTSDYLNVCLQLRSDN